MQEEYGFQEDLVARLGSYFQIPFPKDNLCMFSRYSMEILPSASAFCSNPEIVRMGEGREVLVDDCWTSYAYRPDYTCSFPNMGYDVTGWGAEDSIQPLADTRRMLEQNINQV